MLKNIGKDINQGTTLRFEKRLWLAGLPHVCGVDEVGRGSLAGPVMACAVLFDQGYFNADVLDSKLISSKKRNILERILVSEAIEWQIGLATPKEIDYLNIRRATFLAMRRAINALKHRPDFVLVDGEKLPNGICPSLGIIKGDQKSFTIAAASIIAKERRDALMVEKSEVYPAYRFERNKGYGTKEHINAIVSEGKTSFHRRSFLKKLTGKIET
jgi:ribonuclease HII